MKIRNASPGFILQDITVRDCFKLFPVSTLEMYVTGIFMDQNRDLVFVHGSRQVKSIGSQERFVIDVDGEEVLVSGVPDQIWVQVTPVE